MSDDKNELDLTAIEARLANSTGPWNLKQEDTEGVYIALATETAKWSIVAINGECDGDLALIGNAWDDITALIAEVKRLRERYETPSSPTSSVASQLGVMLMVEQVEAGKTIEIPSLGIKLTKDNLRERED